MTEKDNVAGKTGPQGTQVFEVSDINKMIAKEIVDSRSENANMPALIGVSNDVIGQQYILRKDKIEIGRRPNSDIVLTEVSVSSMHAQIIGDDGSWRVLNLLSSNGTFVNGEKVVDRTLEPGDMVAFAGSEFVFSLVEDDESQAGEKSSNGIMIVGIVLAVAIAAMIYFFM
ncbi:MAG: FHA domain-containing protein [Kangiellaceae bacterium]|nr:FHA domain-containing protein [Kangiellaceae bacterium]